MGLDDQDREWLDAPDLAAARERFGRSTSRYLAIAGVDLHLLDEGPRSADRSILLLSAQWLGVSQGDRWAPAFTDRYRVVRVDLPGQGLSGPFPHDDYSARAYADLIASLIAALGLGDHVVVGTSFSGIAATLYAATRPAGLIGLVLATSSGLPRSAADPAPGAPPPDPTLADMRDGCRPRRFYDWKLGTLLRRPAAADVTARRVDEAHVLNELPGRAAEAQARVARYDPTELSRALPGVAVPLLVQWSSGSTYLPPAMAERIAALAPNSAGVHHYPDTGHLLLLDAPEECARDLLAFVERL